MINKWRRIKVNFKRAKKLGHKRVRRGDFLHILRPNIRIFFWKYTWPDVNWSEKGGEEKF
jgi:hypothetical protein